MKKLTLDLQPKEDSMDASCSLKGARALDGGVLAFWLVIGLIFR